MNENFRGHLEECLKHLAARFLEVYPKGSKKAAEARRPLVEFCGVSPITVAGWLYRSNHLPHGGRYIKLVCFLELNGYKVIEFDRLPQKYRNFAKLIGFGLITSEEATEMLGYSDPSSIFQVLYGNEGTSSKVEEKLWDMWKVRKDKLDEIVEEATKKYRLDFSTVSHQTASLLSERVVSPNTKNCPKDGVVDIMQGLLKLLDSGVLQDLTKDNWAALRSSSSVILRLSSHLSTLSAQITKPS